MRWETGMVNGKHSDAERRFHATNRRNARDERSVRRSIAAWLRAATAVLIVCFAAGHAVAADADVTCEGKGVCRMTKTRLPLRVLPRVNSSIYEAKDANSRVVES